MLPIPAVDVQPFGMFLWFNDSKCHNHNKQVCGHSEPHLDDHKDFAQQKCRRRVSSLLLYHDCMLLFHTQESVRYFTFPVTDWKIQKREQISNFGNERRKTNTVDTMQHCCRPVSYSLWQQNLLVFITSICQKH